MRRFPAALPLLLLILASPRLAAAGDTSTCITPMCPKGQFVICTTCDRITGQVRWREGTTCGDTHWQDPCAFTVVETSRGEKSDYMIEGKGWWVRYNVAPTGVLTAMWGRTSTGINWVADAKQPRIN